MAAIASASAPAGAKPLGHLDNSKIPAECRKLGHAPTPTQDLVLQQRISIATCMAGVALDKVQRTIVNPSAGIAPLGDAAAPSILLLDEVIAYCDPETAILAQHAKGDIYVSLAVRLRNTVPPDTAVSTRTDLVQHAAIRASIEPAARAWLAAGARAFGEAVAMSEHHPELRPNRVVARAAELSSEGLADAHTVVGAR
jgi:hypothetical protein